MPESQLCGYEQDLLAEITQRGQVVSRFNLVNRILGLANPTWAASCLDRLEQKGLIRIYRRGVGRPMVITARHLRRNAR